MRHQRAEARWRFNLIPPRFRRSGYQHPPGEAPPTRLAAFVSPVDDGIPGEQSAPPPEGAPVAPPLAMPAVVFAACDERSGASPGSCTAVCGLGEPAPLG